MVMKFIGVFLTASLFLFSSAAHAYVGPGPGLSMIGSFFTLLGGIVLALFMVFAYPIRLLLKRRKKSGKTDSV